MHSKEEMPHIAFTHFLSLLDFLVEKDAKDLAVELVYDYYGGNIEKREFELCDVVLNYFMVWSDGKFPGWLAMPFLTISKPYEQLENYDKLFGFSVSKWEQEMKPEHLQLVMKRLNRR